MTRALLVVGHGSRKCAGTDEFLRFVSALAPRWPERLVRACFLELTDPPLIPTLSALIADGVTDITVGPAFLLAAGHIKNDVPAALDIARAQHAGVTIRYAAPLGVEPRLVRALQDRIQAVTVDVPQDDTIVLLIGRGTSDPDANADVYKLGRLLWEGRAGKGVEVAFTSLTHPTVPEGIARCVALGARHVVVVPLFLFTGVLVRRIAAQVETEAAHYPDVSFTVTDHLGGDPLLADLFADRVREAEAGMVRMNCDTCVYRAPSLGFEDRAGRARHSDASHGLRGMDGEFDGSSHTHVYGLPPPLAIPVTPGRASNPVPMSSAPMRYAADGSVDWGTMWDSFCALAQDGGPPQRGTLLAAGVESEPESNDYRASVAEIIHGVTAVSGLTAVPSTTGWIAVHCPSASMAAWLCAAILQENVAARVDGSILFIPVGEDFRVEKEIKNIITVVAKTTHYWAEHLRPQARRA